MVRNGTKKFLQHQHMAFPNTEENILISTEITFIYIYTYVLLYT